MPAKSHQSDRLAAEQQSMQVATAKDIVKASYRLKPPELHHRHTRALIRSVGMQGLETLTPLVHFDGILKPLLLHPDDVALLQEYTGSSLFANWEGREVVVEKLMLDGVESIRLRRPDVPLPLAPVIEIARQAGRSYTGAILLLLLVVALTVLVFWLERR